MKNEMVLSAIDSFPRESQKDRLKSIKVKRVRGREFVVGSSHSSGHLESVGHVAADNTLSFLMTDLREAAKRGGGDLIHVAVGINNSRSSADNKKLWHSQ